ncbi:MAG: TonB-dependent receptor plug domain-containing protein [Cyclobacteriaceae bacterium]|nr:TonB-dependent receptor plug domain-containing protein [Cyclobacteriaceae bacterium]MCH8516217.1 TonB-dependent receptor plug domain-containing protein [Cyclobacteriaceae bacterium]
MNRYLPLLVFFLLSITFASAQDRVLDGSVSDLSGSAVANAFISFPDFPDKNFVSDSAGFFTARLPFIADSIVIMEVQHISYSRLQVPIDWSGKSRLEISIVLTENVTELDDVEIVSFDVESREQPGLFKIDPKQSQYMPVAFGDFSNILSSLPGVSSNNELSTGYSVRGGNYDENLTYVNDIPVYRPFLIRAGQQEGLSFVNPDLARSVSFSSGGWTPEFGDALSSVMNVTYKKPDDFSGSLSAGLLGGTFHLESRPHDGKTSVVMGSRLKSGAYLLNTLETEGQYLPRFIDAQAYIEHDLSKKGKPAKTTTLGALLYYAQNRYDVRPETRETNFGTINQPFRLLVAFDGSERMQFDTYQGGLRFEHQFSNTFRSMATASMMYTRESEFVNVEGGYRLCDVDNEPGSASFNECVSIRGIGSNFQYARNELQARIINFENRNYWTPSDRHEISFGVGARIDRFEDSIDEFTFADSAGFVRAGEVLFSNLNLNTTRYFAYVQNTYRPNRNHTLTLGLRMLHWDFNGQTVVNPRVQYAYKPDWTRRVSFQASVGQFSQMPFYREFRFPNGTLNENILAQDSWHFITGMKYDFNMWSREFVFSAELYYKHLDNVIPYDIDNVRIRYFGDNIAEAYAVGADFRVSGEFIPGAESWFSLGLLQTEENLGDERGFVPRATNQLINAAIFFQDHLPNDPSVKMNLMAVYGSGLPFGPPFNPQFRNAFINRPYRRVDIGFSKIFSLENSQKLGIKHLNSIWLGLDIMNLLGSDNPISFLWVSDFNNRQYGVPNSLTQRFFNFRTIVQF